MIFNVVLLDFRIITYLFHRQCIAHITDTVDLGAHNFNDTIVNFL